MQINPVFGKCHICGIECNLTFEHIPPRKAFNNTGVLLKELDIHQPSPSSLDNNKGKIFQKGMGSYSLCQKCNNTTGQWYGSHFVEYCKKGMRVLQGSNYNPKLFYLLDIYPLSIIKQIISMFLSINSLGFRESNIDLTHFVLNKNERHLNPKYHFYTYYNVSGMHRVTPISGKISFNSTTFDNATTTLMTELSFPPYGYLLCIDTQNRDPRVFDISHFSHYNYGSKMTMSMDYPILPTHTIYPGDYRTQNEIRQSLLENQKWSETNE